jgi:hypothetical protein
LLGINVELLRAHTIAAAHPWATGLVAQGAPVANAGHQPRLRYVACPHCLERQRAGRGESWLRRAWVLAPRTVCPVHLVALAEKRPGDTTHPVWSDFLHRHRRSDAPVCAAAQDASAPLCPASMPACDGPVDLLHREKVGIQDGILADASRGLAPVRRQEPGEGRAIVAADLVWAFTRADRHCPDRLVYAAISSDLLYDAWHMARRRRPGPVEFSTLRIDQRHLLLATATVCAGPPALRRAFRRSPVGWRDDFATLHHRLRDADRTDLAERRKRWPDTA